MFGLRCTVESSQLCLPAGRTRTLTTTNHNQSHARIPAHLISRPRSPAVSVSQPEVTHSRLLCAPLPFIGVGATRRRHLASCISHTSRVWFGNDFPFLAKYSLLLVSCRVFIFKLFYPVFCEVFKGFFFCERHRLLRCRRCFPRSQVDKLCNFRGTIFFDHFEIYHLVSAFLFQNVENIPVWNSFASVMRYLFKGNFHWNRCRTYMFVNLVDIDKSSWAEGRVQDLSLGDL